MTINIVIPVLNEEESLRKGVVTTINFLNQTKMVGLYHITVADNGSTDQTPVIAQELAMEYPCVDWFKVSRKGVGLAFREAIKRNQDDIVGYMDVDLATDIRHLTQVYDEFEKPSVSAVVGSRLLPGSRVYGRTLKREITSRGLNILLHLILHVKFSDAMCGFKFYRKNIADRLVKECSQNDGWFYCAEMMIRAEWNHIPVTELAVEWHDDANSKVKVGKLSMNYLKNIRELYFERKRVKK